MGLLSFLGSVAGPVIGGLLGLKGAKSRNDTEIELANTAYQRRVKDLQAAGLNPMLAYMSGGADTPNLINEQQPMGDAVNSAISGFSASQMARQSQAQIRNIDAQTANVSAQTAKTKAETQIVESSLPFSGENALANARILQQQWEKLRQEAASAELDRYSKEFDLEKIKPLLQQFQALRNQSEKAGLPMKEAEAKFFDTVPAAKWFMLLRQMLGK